MSEGRYFAKLEEINVPFGLLDSDTRENFIKSVESGAIRFEVFTKDGWRKVDEKNHKFDISATYRAINSIIEFGLRGSMNEINDILFNANFHEKLGEYKLIYWREEWANNPITHLTRDDFEAKDWNLKIEAID